MNFPLEKQELQDVLDIYIKELTNVFIRIYKGKINSQI